MAITKFNHNKTVTHDFLLQLDGLVLQYFYPYILLESVCEHALLQVRPVTEEHLGMLGPLIRAAVRIHFLLKSSCELAECHPHVDSLFMLISAVSPESNHVSFLTVVTWLCRRAIRWSSIF